MDVVHFRLSGKFGHFLKAEANRDMPSYPIPPRTSLLGLIGAILGLSKDTPQIELEPAYIAIKGRSPDRFWIQNKFHQSLPSQLNYKITQSQKGSSRVIENQKILTQEWLFNPEFEIWVSLPSKYHSEFTERIENRRWHFQPCLGISEHFADIQWLGNSTAKPLNENVHFIHSVFPKECGKVKMDIVFEKHLAIHSVRMPAVVSKNRVFKHKEYFFERESRPIPVFTNKAFLIDNQKIVFL
ncbi:type I-B CRISPR-associated protein Cas5 [bacterium]|nr:MAG: type I-B CRISPR-associated protein Cas5 [bacterium]